MESKKYILKHEKYNNILSFGCMCSTALHLKKIGVRSVSSFFDWINSDFRINLDIVNNDFHEVFNKDYFVQDFPGFPNIVKNSRYGFHYVHVFNTKETLEKQYKSSRRYVEQRIKNFYKSLNDKCLLVYYSRSKEDSKWIMHNQSLIKSFCDRYNCDFAFVFNFKFDGSFIFPAFTIPQNNIHKPFGGGVSYLFENTDELDSFLLAHFDDQKRKRNLLHKGRESFFHRLKRKIQSRKKDIFFIN